jgi:dihydrofolate synthase/folylpolyglutamate synthase
VELAFMTMTASHLSGISTTLPAGHSDAIHPNPDIAQRLKRIYALNRDTINLRLECSPYNVLLERLGNPHLDLPPTIHIAGTNGKGSTLAFLRSILEHNGYRVHQYTSPHLNLFNERIVLGGKEIFDDILIAALDHIDALNSDNPVTFFEYTTALAFYLFAQHKTDADFLLLEVGMGGRLDCTNIIEAPICTAITKIGFDHQQYLGDTAVLIASDKAGIIKNQSPCVIGVQDHPQDVHPVFERIATEKNTALSYADPAPLDAILGLDGNHQYENAGTALTVIEEIAKQDFEFRDDKITDGLKNAAWRGRLEHIQSGRLHDEICDIFGQNTSIYIDGGHNVTAAHALRDTLTTWKAGALERPIYMLLGMGHDKDVNAFLDILGDQIDSLYLLDVSGGLHPQDAQQLADKLNKKYSDKATLWAEIASSKTLHNNIDIEKNNAPLILICGSLFLYSLL